MVFHSADASSSSSIAYKFKTTRVLHRGETSTVYKGVLSGGGEAPVKAVAKLRYGTDPGSLRALEAEFERYQTLAPLQGDVVPKCYGLFKIPYRHTACLLLEYCGEALDKEFEFLPMDLRLDIGGNLLEIHGRGLQHNDFRPRNVVVRPDTGKPVIVDFEHATPHNCKCTADIVEGGYPPCESEFGCFEIYHYVLGSGIWRPGYFLVKDTAIPEMDAGSIEEIEQAARRNGVQCSAKELRQEAERVLKLAKLIDEHGGILPRDEVLEERDIYF